jgi:hypothetical protein
MVEGQVALSTGDIAKEGDGTESIESSDNEGEVSEGSHVEDPGIIVSEGGYVDAHRELMRLCNPQSRQQLAERIKKAPRRLRQYRDYIKLMEDRLCSVEKRLAEFEANGKPIPKEEATEGSSPPIEPVKRVPAIPEINRVRWGEFKAPPPDQKAVYAIDVLVGEPVVNFQKPSRRGTNGIQTANNTRNGISISGLDSAKDSKDSAKLSPGPSGGHGQLAERIRINSLPLWRILAKVQDDVFFFRETPAVIFRPYRVLLHYEEELREWLKKLESKFASKL